MIVPEIIIKWNKKHGKCRSEIETNLRKEGWGSSITAEQIDKCKFIEKKIEQVYGTDDGKTFVKTTMIDALKDK